VLCRTTEELLVKGSAFERWALLMAVMAAGACARECERYIGEFFSDCADSCTELIAVANSLAADVLTTSDDLGSIPGRERFKELARQVTRLPDT
jgi:hypothetical protein